MKKRLIPLLAMSMISFMGISQAPVDDFTWYNEGQAFTSITSDPIGGVWAGTNNAGLFNLPDGPTTEALNFSDAGVDGDVDLSTVDIKSLAADKVGSLWVGHRGVGGLANGIGGMERVSYYSNFETQHLSADRNAECYQYLERDGLASRYTRNITVDPFNTVWSAHGYDNLWVSPKYILTPGSLSRKYSAEDRFYTYGTYEDYRNQNDHPGLPYPAFTCNTPITESQQSRTCNSVGSDSTEVWMSVYPYKDKATETFMPSRLLRFDVYNGNYLGEITFETIGIPAGGVFNGIFRSLVRDETWVTMSASKGFAIRKDGVWRYMPISSFSCLLPEGTYNNENAIWGNTNGQVFIGTNNGLLVYNGFGNVATSSSYSFYSSEDHNMLSNNIVSGYSQNDSIQWIATNNGIMKTIIGRYSSVDSISPTSCNIDAMTLIENMDMAHEAATNQSYHLYSVTTEICSKEGVNGHLCTAEYIYSLMKENVSLTAPIVADFPLEGLSPVLLTTISDEDVSSINRAINATEPSESSSHPAGIIDYISPYLTTSQKLKNFTPFIDIWDETFVYEWTDEIYQESMNAVNSKEANSCETYALYNNSVQIGRRFAFDISIDHTCGNRLHSHVYDYIHVFTFDDKLTIKNFTADGHFLYPGFIKREVVEDCGSVKVITTGEGTQYCGNTLAGKMSGNGNILLGSIIFKNVDFRLKYHFENL